MRRCYAAFAAGSYYLTRNSLSYVAPTLLNDKAIGLTMTQIGGLTSILPVCYGERHASAPAPLISTAGTAPSSLETDHACEREKRACWHPDEAGNLAIKGQPR